ncbi:transcription termination factor 2 [Lampris incognitus]|uniref:transcription termination factor 2 n=1 Tax=Lampris incognitus TaxID=2546036 RepID=UPI0024B55D42|nr:transcription termination factor 2 [Lampris incognitus]
MERVLCNTHGSLCMLKTGMKEGPNKGKSFYVCTDKRGCDFSQVASVPPSHCLHHEDSMVELQALTYNQQQQICRLFFRCVVGKTAGQRWCGSVPYTGPEKEKRNPLADRQLQPSCLPPVRNPFKVPSNTDKDSGLRKMLNSGSGENGRDRNTERKGEKKDRQMSLTDGRKESHPTGNVGGKNALEEEAKSNLSDSYRDKQQQTLGVTIKKSVSDKKINNPQTDREKKIVDEPKVPTSHEDGSEVKNKNSASSVLSMHADQTPNTSKSSQRNSPHQTSGTLESTGTRSGKDVNLEGKETTPALTTQGTTHTITNTNHAKNIPKCNKSAQPCFSQSKEHQDAPKYENQCDKPFITQEKSKEPIMTTQFRDDDDDDEDDDNIQLVSVKPGTRKTPSVAPAQKKTLTSFPGFQLASQMKRQQEDLKGLHSLLSAQLKQKKTTLSVVNVSALPDKGERLKTQVKELEDALESLSLTVASESESQDGDSGGGDSKSMPSQMNPFQHQRCTILLPAPPAPSPHQYQASGSSLGLQLSQGFTQMYGAKSQAQTFYGSRMTENRLLAIENPTCEATNHLYRSLESCPGPDTEAPNPKGIMVDLLPHQKKALAWLLWRETQEPCGGILADDMGLGKTLTMIALILAQRKKDEKKEDKMLDSWLSKNDCSLVGSKGTLIICPASLIHHWKKEIDRHVKRGQLSVYLYHGPNRQKSTKVLASHDVVVTTYSLVCKEVPIQKEDAEKPSKDADDVPSHSIPLFHVTWARVVLDEAHNIKNPKVQTSIAVCQLRAQARWAVTGTPIQNNLLDMYSLLKFLHCSPFDDYKLWKAQVDNGSKRGGERLNILTRSLLLRRTKDQLDSSGAPLVSLPNRTCELHHLRLSKDEQAVYDVIFAQSRSTLQNYLRRHEGNDLKKENTSTANPFERVATEFGMSQAHIAMSSQRPQQATSTVHILSLLLRLRQCCSHLSLLKKTLDQSELQGDGIILTLEEQLSALSLSSGSSSSGPDPKDTVSLNGRQFTSQLFKDTCESTKISAIISELNSITQKGEDQKSVIVSQWTSMLRIVAVHLRVIGLRYAIIDGTVNPKLRMDLVEEFNTNRKGPKVMLVSLCAGGVGLNLIGGNHLFLIDMHWNPALEDQACDRIYRVGQRKDVTIHRFVCEGTVEEKISTLQKKKKELAQKVLSGTGASFTKLSLADLRIIFGV